MSLARGLGMCFRAGRGGYSTSTPYRVDVAQRQVVLQDLHPLFPDLNAEKNDDEDSNED